jgi:YVTN family beta-propeller protein
MTRFTLLRQLGRGAMGVVWQARDEETGQLVALKLLRAVYADDPEVLERFAREVELAQRVRSAHVVRVLGYGTREGTPYLALEYIEGPSLRARLAEHGPYAWPEARALLAQLAEGLADVHAAGILHRDLKPSNVLLAPDGTAKLTDFGIARGLDLTRVTSTSALLGTPAYLPPEGHRDARSDLYSLGVVAYELLTGAPPFEGESHEELLLAHLRTPPDLERLPPEARPIVGALLAKDPAGRPQSAHALLAALWGGGSVPRSVPAPSPPPSPTRPPVPRALVGLGVLGLVVLLAAGVLVVGRGPGASGTAGSSSQSALTGPVAAGAGTRDVAGATGSPSPGPASMGGPPPTPASSPGLPPTALSRTYRVGAHPQGLASDGTDIWVANTGSNSVTRLDAATGAAVGTYAVGVEPVGVAFDKTSIWVTNYVSNSVTKLDAATGALVGTYAVGTGPGGVVFDGTNIWVADFVSNSVTKLDATTGVVVGTYRVGVGPVGVAFDGTSIWVTNWHSHTVTRLAAATGGLVGTYPVGTDPVGVAFDGTSIWVANSGSNTVMKLATTGAVMGTYGVGAGPEGVALDGPTLWVTSLNSNTVTELAAATGGVVGTYGVGASPLGVAFDGTSIWVANSGSNTVTKLTLPAP